MGCCLPKERTGPDIETDNDTRFPETSLLVLPIHSRIQVQIKVRLRNTCLERNGQLSQRPVVVYILLL